MITLRQLRYLAALAKHGHFGRAADACSVTQPALSMQIRDLERTLGVAVVERRPGDVMLTDVGREIARRAEDVLTASRDLVDFARHRSGLLTGRLTLGVIPSLAPYLLPRILPLLQSRFPELQLELRETQTRQLIEDIKSGALADLTDILSIYRKDFSSLPDTPILELIGGNYGILTEFLGTAERIVIKDSKLSRRLWKWLIGLPGAFRNLCNNFGRSFKYYSASARPAWAPWAATATAWSISMNSGVPARRSDAGSGAKVQ